MDFQSLIKSCEASIRAADFQAVRRVLLQESFDRAPRRQIATLASLCRRVALNIKGLKLLMPFMFTDRGFNSDDATPDEVAEYGFLLLAVGATNESLRLLEKAEWQSHPKIVLHQAFCHFSRWEYELALPVLDRYLSFELTEYERLTGLVNAAAAYVATQQLDKAAKILDEAKRSAVKLEARRLQGNICELSAQIKINQGEMNDAERLLENAHEIFSDRNGAELLVIRKWQAYILARRTGRFEMLAQIQSEAVKDQRWEIARDVDFLRLKTELNPDLFAKLLVGTPFVGYRLRVLKSLGQPTMPEVCTFGEAGARSVDVRAGKVNRDGVKFNLDFDIGSQSHRLMNILVDDLYRPSSLGSLFSRLHPEEHFNILNSPARVHQSLFRLRQAIQKSRASAPFAKVEASNGLYRLVPQNQFHFLLRESRRPANSKLDHLASLSTRFGSELFTGKAGAQQLGLRPDKWKAFINEALADKRAVKIGAGRSTVYGLLKGNDRF